MCLPFFAVLGAASELRPSAQADKPVAPPATSKKPFSDGVAVRLGAVDSIIRQAIADGNVPGAVLVVGHNGAVIYRKAYGERALEPRREPMTVDTIFDLASLTKVIATTTAMMQLVELGKVRMNDPVAKYLPEFAQNGKDDITVRQLMTHYSGLAPDLDLTTPWEGKDTAFQLAFIMPPETTPGSGFVYSDINFITLGALVEKVSGETLDAYATKHIFAPLKMMHTRFVPPASWRSKIAPTQYDEDEQMLRGVVHDPTARRMGGVAGHAGLFSTADDLAKFAQALLNGGGGILSPLAVEKMTTPEQPPSAPVLRGFGWDIDSPFSTNRGDLLPVGSFGHTGFTGTSIWIDPTTQTYIILLTNAVHPRGRERDCPAVEGGDRSRGGVESDDEREGRAALEEHYRLQRGVERGASHEQPQWIGEDRHRCARGAWVRLLKPAEGQPPEKRKRIGLVTNQTGVDASGARTIDVLAQAPGVSLEAIFSPEHGVTGDTRHDARREYRRTRRPGFRCTACTAGPMRRDGRRRMC